jgi:hypothetical protein
MSVTASAYVPPELKTGTQMSEIEIVKIALAEHDAGRDTRWVIDTLEDATIHNTNNGRTINNYASLRDWIAKIESQKTPTKYDWVTPIDDAGWQGPGSN